MLHNVKALLTSGLVFVGGGLGANARYWLGTLIASRLGNEFPYGTAIINITGSFVIGLFMAAMLRQGWHENSRLLFAVGILGGYTTFSSYSYEAIGLFEKGAVGLALAYVGGSVLLGLATCYLGMAFSRAVLGPI
jgi:fluoride exporter